MADDDAYRRYVEINLPHTRTLVARLGQSIGALGGFSAPGNGGRNALAEALGRLEREASPLEEDPPPAEAIAAADRLAGLARDVVAALIATRVRGDHLGQVVRNIFECLGLKAEGAELSLRCGERPDSPLR